MAACCSVTLALTLLTTIVFGLVPAHSCDAARRAGGAGRGRHAIGGRWRARLAAPAAGGGRGRAGRRAAGRRRPADSHVRPPANAVARLRPAERDRGLGVARRCALRAARETSSACSTTAWRGLRAVPGVESAAVSLGLAVRAHPEHGRADRWRRWRARASSCSSTATYVTPGYFETLRLPLRARPDAFGDRDSTTRPRRRS